MRKTNLFRRKGPILSSARSSDLLLLVFSTDIKSIAWVPSTRALISASYDNTIKVWNECNDEWLCTQTLDSSYQGHETTVWDLCCDHGGTKILSCDNEGMILLWEVTGGRSEAEEVALKLVSRNMVPSRSSNRL